MLAEIIFKIDRIGFDLLFQSSTYYQNCACVMSKADPIGKVEKGVCQVECGLNLLLLLIVLSAVALMTFLNDTPAIVVTLRYCFLTFRMCKLLFIQVVSASNIFWRPFCLLVDLFPAVFISRVLLKFHGTLGFAYIRCY